MGGMGRPMSVQGRRIHIAGSAAHDTADELLAAAQELVRAVTPQLIDAGAGIVTGVGSEPVADTGRPCIFDWTVLDAVSEASDPAPGWSEERGARFLVVASQRGLEKIPDHRREVWASCVGRADFDIETIPAGWRMGGAIRTKQVNRGDVLVALGGGDLPPIVVPVVK